MPAELLTRLLRVLSDKYYRVGGNPDQDQLRIIAATHQNLEERVAGLFREDLFHRLNVIRLYLPLANAGRHPLLAKYFCRKAEELSVEQKTFNRTRYVTWQNRISEMSGNWKISATG